MAVLIPRRIPHFQKPSHGNGAEYPGLVNVWTFWEGAGNIHGEVTNRQGIFTAGSVWDVSEEGRVWKGRAATTDEGINLSSTGSIPTGSRSWLIIASRDRDTPTSGNDKVEACISTRPAATGDGLDLNLGNGFGSGSDLNKPRFNSFGGGSNLAMWINGVKQASINPAPTILDSGRFYTFFVSLDGLVNGGEYWFGSHGGAFALFGRIAYVAEFDRRIDGDEAVDLSRNPFSLLKPRRRWVPVVIQGGATVSVGLASELSTAQAISRQKQKAVGLSAETDTALATSPAKVTAVGLSTETDTAFSILRSKIKTAGLSNETDSAFALIVSNAVNVGLSAETDSAFAISRLKQKPVGLSTETDAALSVGRSKIRIAGIGIETDVAFTISRSKLKELGLSSETDEALAISSAGSVAVGLASELDVALVIGRLKQQLLGQSSETDISQPVSKIKTQQAGLSTESDAALAVTGSSGRVVGLATEADLAQSISRIKQKLIGLAPETDVALAVTIAGVTVVINTNAKETLKLLAENPTLTLSAENATLTLS